MSGSERSSTDTPIPIVDLSAQHEALGDEMMAAVSRCLAGGRFILGPEVEALEQSVASVSGARFGIGVSSGTDALLASLMALGVGPGDEVVVPAYSFFATAGVVTRLGAKPVFVDIEPRSYNIDVEQLEAALTKRTRAIVPVHLYGQLADMERVAAIASSRDVPVVEDAAQAIGACGVGRLSRLACYSFYPSKNVGAVGEAGLVVTDDEGLKESLVRLRNHGGGQRYVHEEVGGNFRMDAIQAAVLNVKMTRLVEWTQARRDKARVYDELLREQGLVDGGLVVPPEALREHVFHQYVIRSDERDTMRERLSARSIASAVYYPIPLPHQKCFRELGHREGEFPVSEMAARQTLALPMFPELTRAQQDRVVSALAG